MAKLVDLLGSTARAVASVMTAPRYLTNGSRLPVNASSRGVARAQPTQELAYATQVPFGSDERAMFVDGDPGRALREGFTASHYVYLCIQLLASELSRPSWTMEKRSDDKEKGRTWDTVPDSDFEALMAQPNEFQSGIDMLERAFQHLFLTGNALLLKVRGAGNRVKELWVVPPDQIKPVPSRKVFLSHYEYRAPGDGPMAIDPDDIVHLMICDPANPFWGMSPLKAMSRLIDTEIDAMNWWKWSIRNRAVKDGIIRYKRLLTPKEYDRIKSRLYEQVLGPWNSRLPLILTGDAEWVQTGQSAVDMDFIDLRKMTREEICICIGVDPILVGIADKATYSNKKEARLTLWQDKLLGFTDKMRSTIDLQLLVDFIRPSQRRTFRSGLDLSRVPALLLHLADLADAVEKYRDMGWTPNELNRRFGLGFKTLPDFVGDRSYVSTTVTVVTDPAEEPAAPLVGSPEWVALHKLAGEHDPGDHDLHKLAGSNPSPRALPPEGGTTGARPGRRAQPQPAGNKDYRYDG